MNFAGASAFVVCVLSACTASAQIIPEKPKITRNYAAELNKPTLAIPENERAWPIYLDVMIAIARDAPQHWTQNRDVYPRIIDDREVAAHVKRQGPQLRRAIAASKLPHLGHILSDQRTAEDIRFNARHLSDEQRARYGTPTLEPPSENPELGNVLLQPAGESDELMDMLAAHALLSASAGDLAAAVDDIETIFRFAAQLREIPFIIGDLKSLTQFSRGLWVWGLILERHPDAFSAEQLTRLEAAAQAFAKGQPLVRLASERINFADMMQRTFPDDGRGDGILIRGGTKVSNPASLFNLVAPVWKQTVLSRKKNVEAFDRLITLGQRELERPLWESQSAEYDVELARVKADETLTYAGLMSFPVRNVQIRQDDAIQKRDVVVAASAATRFLKTNGRYPTTLDELIPKYLPKLPLDRYTGKPLGYKLEAGRPIIYSIGNDRHDDGGAAGARTTTVGLETQEEPWHWALVTSEQMIIGDLILFPVQPKLEPIKRAEEPKPDSTHE